MVAHNCNISSQEVQTGGSWIPGQFGVFRGLVNKQQLQHKCNHEAYDHHRIQS